MKQGRTETVPGQLASGQTLRFDPFSCLYLNLDIFNALTFCHQHVVDAIYNESIWPPVL